MAEPRLVITCEHGGHEVPEPYAALFRDQAATLTSHRGWDLGALRVATRLASTLRVPLFFTTASRLLIDTNRSPGHPRLFSEFSRQLSTAEREKIIGRYYRPHRDQVMNAVNSAIAAGRQVLHLAIHSFTPELNGTVRRADLGLLYDSALAPERELALGWQATLGKARPGWTIRRNYPYQGRSDGLATCLRQHYPSAHYLGLEVEINQRLLATPAECEEIADLLDQTLSAGLTSHPPPPAPLPSPADEVVVIVDADNRIIGEATRCEMRRQNLIHRAAYILVFNTKGQLLVQKRTLSKDLYPGYYDLATGGVVVARESYEESARRELREELGVTAELTFLFDHYFSDQQNQVWGRVFRCQHDGPFVLQASEVESCEFMTPAEILAHPGHFTPDGLAVLALLFPSAKPLVLPPPLMP